MTMLGERMGKSRIFDALNAFHFGRPTGIELPGEDPGRVNPLRKWSRVTTESISQGYELMVTPIQLARAMCAIANGGRMVYPRIVKGELDPSGNLIPAKRPTPLGLELNVIDPITAAQVRRILCDVPIRGTARGTRSFYWNLFGKTGTAHISNGKAGYSDSKYNSSYLGGAPYENPRLVIAFLLHEPDMSISL
jgi:cell division protein FtsI/penicillin-binding protein 2